MTTKTELTRQTIDVFWSTFPPLWHQIRAYIREEAIKKFDITVGQIHILRRIKSGKNSVSMLADDRHTSRATISRTVDTLVNKGWLARTPNPNDRRHVQLSITSEGQILLNAIFENVGDWMESHLITLAESELENINQALLTLIGAFESEKQ